tara:strand:+ start:843 stop:1061 length:219 start_codon:yes stop_codon:yes gene_type:complete
MFICVVLIFSPIALHAGEINSPIKVIEPGEIVEAPNEMTQKEMNDLFGEDPYLGQTSYLQSHDDFNQRRNSK